MYLARLMAWETMRCSPALVPARLRPYIFPLGLMRRRRVSMSFQSTKTLPLAEIRATLIFCTFWNRLNFDMRSCPRQRASVVVIGPAAEPTGDGFDAHARRRAMGLHSRHNPYSGELVPRVPQGKRIIRWVRRGV